VAVIQPVGDGSQDIHLQTGALEGRAIMLPRPPLPYSWQLFGVAKNLLDQGHFGMAIVVAHTACEVAAENQLSRLLKSKQIGEALEDAIVSFLNGYSLNDDRSRDLYNALAGEQIQKESFWERYKLSIRRRNAVAHRGAIMQKGDAEASLQVADEFVRHMKQ
jgi:hypothetical protein